jgi:hypothetical protein
MSKRIIEQDPSSEMKHIDHCIWVYRAMMATIASSVLLLPAWIKTVNRAPQGAAWQRHTIDAGLDGSDGTKLADINGDGYLDISTAWESAGITRVYYHPGPTKVRDRWRAITVGETPSAEDATFVDLDQDGSIDVVTSMETGQDRLAVHWGATSRGESKDPYAWAQEDLSAARNVTRWMFTQPITLPGQRYPAIVAGGKSVDNTPKSFVGLFRATGHPRDLNHYQWTPLARATWVMSIEVHDVNGDGYDDIVYSDKKGQNCGVWWIENPGPTTQAPWPIHPVTQHTLAGCMFLDITDLDQDGTVDIVVGADMKSHSKGPVRRVLIVSSATDSSASHWKSQIIDLPPRTGQPKAVSAGDLNEDGQLDLVVTSTGADDRQIGVYWLEKSVDGDRWIPHNIAGPEGIKFDLVHLVDIDRDGDLDVLTSEEKECQIGLGVFWYENQLLPKHRESNLLAHTSPPVSTP